MSFVVYIVRKGQLSLDDIDGLNIFIYNPKTCETVIPISPPIYQFILYPAVVFLKYQLGVNAYCCDMVDVGAVGGLPSAVMAAEIY